MDKEKLQMFLSLLEKVKHPIKGTYDLGLIVKEPKSKIKSQEILKEIKKEVPIEKIVYDKQITDEEILEKVINTFKKKKWGFFRNKKRYQ